MPDGESATRQIHLPRFFHFSPWTLIPIASAVAAAALEPFGFWAFLRAIHPMVLGGVAVVLSLWLLFALVPKITVHTMRGLDLKLPRGDSAVPAVGMLLRIVTVLLGPTLIYLSFMALREDTPRVADIGGAGLVGLVLGAVGWRTVALLGIMRENFAEDEVRKGLLDTGVYTDAAIRKLEEATEEILAESNFDKKRIRLRRLAATDRVIRNKNYDPHQVEHGGTTRATLGGMERQRHVEWAKRNLKRIDLQSDLGDEEVQTKIAEQQARRRQHDSQFHRAKRATPDDDEAVKQAFWQKVRDEMSAEDAAMWVVEEMESRYRGPAEDKERYMERVRASAQRAYDDYLRDGA